MTAHAAPSTEALRGIYRKTARQCIGQINEIRRLAGRRDTYTMQDFNADMLRDMRLAGVRGKPTAGQWVRAARSRRNDLGA
tara:strand:- start:247 stop:489 length:243 start_codon:yes stop_codon:yes gene_type:complete